MTIHWKAIEQYFAVAAAFFNFFFLFVCDFAKLINFGLGTVRTERVNSQKAP